MYKDTEENDIEERKHSDEIKLEMARSTEKLSVSYNPFFQKQFHGKNQEK